MEVTKVVPASVNENVEINRIVRGWRPTILDHGTFDDGGVDRERCQLLVVEHTKNDRLLPEAFTSNLNILVCSISWSTLGERAIYVIEAEGKAIISVVDAIESQIYNYLISSFPTSWRGTFHGLLVHIVGWDVFRWSVFFIEFSWF